MAAFSRSRVSAPLFRECWDLVNLIPKPDMKSGWSLSAVSSPAGYGSGCGAVALTGTTSAPEVCVSTTAGIPLNSTHIYYARTYGRQDTKSEGSVGFYWPIAEPSFYDGLPIQSAGAWRLYSYRNGRSSFSDGNYQFRLDFNNNYAAGTMYFSSPMLIDLTAAFGAGNEPSREWCDANIPFFQGTYELPAAKPLTISQSEICAKKLTELYLPNLIVNGSFEQSTAWSGVTYDTAQHLFGTRSSRLSGNAGTVINTQAMTKPIVNHVYYGRHSIKTDGTASPSDCRFEWFAGDGAGLNFVFGYNRGNYPDWYTESTRMQITAVNGSSYICRNFVVNSTANVWCDGLMIVDLTAAFGAGNEPSREWCDLNLIFEGDCIGIAETRLSAAEFQVPLLEEI